MRVLFVFIPVACLVASLDAEVPAESLQRIKAATVLVSASGRYGEASGSGFVVAARDGCIFIATNAHTTEIDGKPAGSVSVIFDSGAQTERSCDCEVVARDRELDLAVLKTKISPAPKPLDLLSTAELRETMDVYIVGYPFGRSLALGGGNPAVSLAKGTVSSLRRDAWGTLVGIQIDGDVNPGNSGGPIVTGNGALVGICVAKVRYTGIGLAIPVWQLSGLLAGYPQSTTLRERDPEGKTTPVDVTVKLIDPMHNLKRASLLILSEAKAKEWTPGKDGRWGPMPQAEVLELTVKADEATGTTRVSSSPSRKAGYWFQVRTIDREGKQLHTAPRKFYISPGLPVGTVVGKTTDTAPADPGNDWLGQTADAPVSSNEEKRTTLPSTRMLGGEKTMLDGAIAVRLNLSGKDLVQALVWSATNDSFCVVEKSGLVRNVSTPGLMQTRAADLHSECRELNLSSQGIALFMSAREELWLMDPQRLEVKRRIPIRGMKLTAAAPGSAYAVACFASREEADSLAVIDLKTGKTSKQYKYSDLSQQAGNSLRRHPDSALLERFQSLAMSPNGKYVLALSEGCLHRLSMNGGFLEYEEAGPKICDGKTCRIDISPDSQYVAVLCGAGNVKVEDHPDIGRYGTYVYSIANLQQPALSLQQGAYPRTLAFDKKRRRIYGQNAEFQCLVFGTNGRLERKWLLQDGGESLRHVLSDDSSQLLTLTDSSLYWIRFSDSP